MQFPKGTSAQYTTGCEADYLLCTTMPPKLQVETHKPTFFLSFFPDMISGVELVCSLVPCMYPAKIAPRFMCRAEDRKF